MVMENATGELMWIRSFLASFWVFLDKPMKLYYDNQAALHISKIQSPMNKQSIYRLIISLTCSRTTHFWRSWNWLCSLKIWGGSYHTHGRTYSQELHQQIYIKKLIYDKYSRKKYIRNKKLPGKSCMNGSFPSFASSNRWNGGTFPCLHHLNCDMKWWTLSFLASSYHWNGSSWRAKFSINLTHNFSYRRL